MVKDDFPGAEPELPPRGLLKKVEAARHFVKDDVIEERDGVPYIKEDLLNPAREGMIKLNPEFKELINSILLR